MVTPEPEAPERRQLTVMFTDLVGSTDLASALDPEEWHDVLNAYQHRVAAIVSAHGGVIAQFQGDGAVAYFGYPEAQESASRDALVAGMQIVEDMVRLGSELPAALGVSELQARAGLHTGEVLVAPVTAGGQRAAPRRLGSGAQHGGPPAGRRRTGPGGDQWTDRSPGRRVLRPASRWERSRSRALVSRYRPFGSWGGAAPGTAWKLGR